MALPRDAMALSTVCDCVFPDHTHLLFLLEITVDKSLCGGCSWKGMEGSLRFIKFIINKFDIIS